MTDRVVWVDTADSLHAGGNQVGIDYLIARCSCLDTAVANIKVI